MSSKPEPRKVVTPAGVYEVRTDKSLVPVLFCVREQDRGGRIPGFAVLNPATGRIESNRAFASGTCQRPLTLSEPRASCVAAELSRETGEAWAVEQAPTECPVCERDIWANDLDFCYPENRSRTEWRAGCNKHDFGCGHEVVGESREHALALWALPPAPTGPAMPDG